MKYVLLLFVLATIPGLTLNSSADVHIGPQQGVRLTGLDGMQWMMLHVKIHQARQSLTLPTMLQPAAAVSRFWLLVGIEVRQTL